MSAPAGTAGMISGRVTFQNVPQELAYRSAAASSSDQSKPPILARTVIAT